MFIKRKELATIKWNKRFWEINWYAIRKAVDDCVADGTISPEDRKKSLIELLILHWNNSDYSRGSLIKTLFFL